MKLLLIAAILLVSADQLDIPKPFVYPITQGVICDNAKQVEQVLTKIALRREPFLVEGCGMMRGRAVANITPQYWYTTPEVYALIASYTFRNGWVQYGFIKTEPNPDYKPKPEGKPA